MLYLKMEQKRLIETRIKKKSCILQFNKTFHSKLFTSFLSQNN